MKQSADLEAAMPELKSLREAAAAADEKTGDEEVEKVMNSLGSDNAGIKVALKLMRKSDKVGFQKQYETILSAPAATAPAAQQAGHAYLTTNISGTKGGGERSVTTNGDGSVTLGQANAGNKTGAPTGGKQKVDLSKQPGRNRTERAMSHIKASVAGADKWTFEQLIEAASELVRTSEITDVSAA